MTILRERHPFEGRSLQVMGTTKRGGTLQLLVVLPNGSRSLVPASWTDWRAAERSDKPAAKLEDRERCLAPMSDLLHARMIVDALLGRCHPILPTKLVADEENLHAMDPGVSRCVASRAASSGSTPRQRSARRSPQHMVRMLAQFSEATTQVEVVDE